MSESAAEIEARTDAAAAAPKSVSSDGLTVAAHDLQDQIALEKHRAEQAAARSSTLGARFFHTRPPGAT